MNTNQSVPRSVRLAADSLGLKLGNLSRSEELAESDFALGVKDVHRAGYDTEYAVKYLELQDKTNQL